MQDGRTTYRWIVLPVLAWMSLGGGMMRAADVTPTAPHRVTLEARPPAAHTLTLVGEALESSPDRDGRAT